MCGAKPCKKKHCTWNADYREMCEARWVISHYPELSDRRLYIERIERKRGAESAAKLKENLTRAWNEKPGKSHASKDRSTLSTRT